MQLVLERALTGLGVCVGTAWDYARDQVPRFPLRMFTFRRGAGMKVAGAAGANAVRGNHGNYGARDNRTLYVSV